MITFIIPLTCALLSSSANAAELTEELSSLVDKHPRLAAEAQNVTAAKAAITEARSTYLPRLDTNASIGYENTDRTELVPAGDDLDLTGSSAAITATQNIFSGFSTDGSVAAAQSGITQAQAALESTKQQLLFEGTNAYIAVLRQVKLTELSKRNMATLSNQLELEDKRVDRGSGVAVDVLQARSRLQIAKERFTAFEGGLEESLARYMQVFGNAPDIGTMRTPAIPEQKIPESLEVAIEFSIAQHPTLKVSDSTIESLDHQKTIAKSNYYPSVDVVASSSYDEDVSGIRGTDISNSLLLRGSWNLFSGYADKARHKQAVAQHQSAISVGQDTQRRIIEEVKLAWASLNTSRKRADLLENAVSIAGEVYDARTRLRDAGKDTALNVLDAENELFRAQIDAAAARYDYYSTVYRVLLATGQLTLKNASN